MKMNFFLLLMLPIYAIGQNIEDAYTDHEGQWFFSNQSDKVNEYGGEYQIFLDKLFWERNSNFQGAAKTLSMEIVSFPFIPAGLVAQDTCTKQSLHSLNNRVFDIQLVESPYGYIHQIGSRHEYKGLGWEYGDWNIFSKLFRNYECRYEGGSAYYTTSCMCKGDYSLMSLGFAKNAKSSDIEPNDCFIPHTIIKHTIYFHCGDSSSPVMDSISWIYDNTRGNMKHYPFSASNGYDDLPTIGVEIDVVFRPTFLNSYFQSYTETSNDTFYDSGIDPNTGSVDFFPFEEVISNYNICQEYPLYFETANPSGYWSHDNIVPSEDYTADYVHPPQYALVNAPLLNYYGNAWAGYHDISGVSPQPGIPHEYNISHSIDLRTINPSEKIIYNPREVNVNVDLTFPCGYKFITLHGKYPDKENEVMYTYNNYWYDKGIYFPYERDYLTPLNQETNSEYSSTYVIKVGKTITIEPNVIIMDAHFKGESAQNKGILAYDPDNTLGLWTYDENTITVIYLDYDDISCEYFYSHHAEDSLKNFHYNYQEPSNGVNNDCLNIIALSKNSFGIQINENCIGASTLIIYNSFGKKIEQYNSPSNFVNFNGSNYDSGLYFIVLTLNNEIAEVEKVQIFN